ncbi:outer membrane lipoprotein carrier protein LolA [Solimonas sp. K1W22B-7]|uniref:outer membrane lipoprotein chaperone LolA n=1 Tax=Solimonas sp. K1W22B-7 TaxID=2303331 RepID=UPI000E333154|nr:outer membrane lipoprotein chaperone LolA [Solimonas sp. K1W22B-7]AXQ29148.1 outer membrane lipoprotein carrier protein LolA [Solimonas sp. K1W22B-7]
MKLRLFAALLGLAAVLPAHAEDPQATLRKFVDGVQTLTADFSQVQSDEGGKVTGTSSGKLSLSRPGKFRWTYEKPYSQLMVCDGKKIWLYDPDLAQVTVRSAEQALNGTPAALLSQKALLSEAYTLQDGGKDNGASIVRLLPKSADGDFKSIELWLANGVPQRMRFHDQLGGRTDIRFTGIKTNNKVDADQFRFTAPKGVEVVDGGG